MPTVVRAPGSELQALGGTREGQAIGTIAIPTRDHVASELFLSCMLTDWSFTPPGTTVSWQVVQGSILPAQRNELVQRMEGDWILFIDSDMAFDPLAIGRLVATRDEFDLDIVGGLCFQRVAPYQPTLYMRHGPDDGGYLFREQWDDDIVEVDGTGMAFLLIHRRVFERMVRVFENRPGFTWPPREERLKIRPPNFFRWTDGLGEDLRFCQEAKTAGSRIWVDTRIEIQHVGSQTIDRRSFLRELATRDPETEAARRALNDTFGLPTMTAGKAREALGWR